MHAVTEGIPCNILQNAPEVTLFIIQFYFVNYCELKK